MTENESSKFRIRLDDDTPEASLPEEVEDLKIKRLSRRVTFVTVLIPCLIGVILFLGYMDISKRVGKVHDTGTTEVQNLSKDLESRFTALSREHGNFRDSVSNQLASLEKSTASLEANMKEVVTAIRYIREARKIDNNKINTKFTEIEKSLTAVREELENVSSNMSAIETKISQELVMLNEAMDRTKKELQSDIASLSSTKIDKKVLDLAMISQQVHFQEKLKELTARYDKNIESFQQRIKALEQRRTIFPKSEKKPATETNPLKPAASPAVSPEKSVSETGASKSGTIVEQDIR
ncbi:hypothetical protein ACFL7E_05175 [Thermodesulfobacteriota bacterium]